MGEPIRQAVVLAGGKGSRLGALTEEVPKPLLPVGDHPFLEWLVRTLERQGVTDIILTTGYRAEAFELWRSGRSGGPDISTMVEVEPLDTGGALTLLGDRLHERFFVLNGDTLFDVRLSALSELLSEEADVAMALRPVDDTGRYGRVELSNGTVTSFSEKEGGGAGLINGGIYAMRKRVVEHRIAPLSIERHLLPELVRKRRVRGLPCDGFFIDIGLPETLRDAQTSVPAWWASRDSP